MNSTPCPIFVVGATRSGTELIRASLNRHPEIYICEETHYFDDLRPRIGGAIPLAAEDRSVAERYFSSLHGSVYGLGKRNSIDTVLDEIPEDKATADDMFEWFCKEQADRRGRSIWGEKTPRHAFRGSEILTAFPRARIVATVRDPRAVAASYRDWRTRRQTTTDFADEALQREARRVRATYSITLNALLWVATMKAVTALRARFGEARVRLLKFEDLVRDPEPTLRDLCQWLRVEFAREMIEFQVVNSTYLVEGLAGLQSSAIERWKVRLQREEIAYIERLTGPVARQHGYEISYSDFPVQFAMSQLLATPVQIVRSGLANRRRIGSLGEFVRRRIGTYLAPMREGDR